MMIFEFIADVISLAVIIIALGGIYGYIYTVVEQKRWEREAREFIEKIESEKELNDDIDE